MPMPSGDEAHLYDYDYDIGLDTEYCAIETNTTLATPVQPTRKGNTNLIGVISLSGSPARSVVSSRMGFQTTSTEPRPFTSTSGAGFSTSKTAGVHSCNFDPLGQNRGPAPPLAERSENSPEDEAREHEQHVHSLMECSALAVLQQNPNSALEKAKEAGKKERALNKYREAHGMADQIRIDLTYAVCFNLAHVYTLARMNDEALHTYSLLVKNKQYPQSGRLRVNMGNIYYQQGKYHSAIKMYRMALDQIPNSGKHVRFKIMRNIGNSFVRLGQFGDAVQSYETIMGGDPDHHVGFNLVLCYRALGDAEKMRRGFQKLLTLPLSPLVEYNPALLQTSSDVPIKPREVSCAPQHDSQRTAFSGVIVPVDGLELEQKLVEQEACNHILIAARLIAPQLKAPSDSMFGFKVTIQALKSEHELLASEVEMEETLLLMHMREFGKAVKYLKAFERKDDRIRAMAATNLSFIYFLEGNFIAAEQYADLACEHDRYNASALVNKGNCLARKEELEVAKEFYLEAIGVEADCVEAIFNLGIVNVTLGAWHEALQAFEKVHQIVPNNAEVIYQMASFHEARAHPAEALKWCNILMTRVPCDPGVLSQIGRIHNRLEEEHHALHYHLESYRHYPVCLDVVSWLGVWFVKSEMYEKATHFFERASQIQPCEGKWNLMIASCFRRMGNYQRALEIYECIHADHPENIECLRYLIAICKDIGRPYQDFQGKLAQINSSSEQTIQPAGSFAQVSIPEHDSTLRAELSPSNLLRPLEIVTKQNSKSGAPADGSDFDDIDVERLLPGY